MNKMVTLLRFLVLIPLLSIVLLTINSLAGEPDKTPEDIQKKAVITKYPSVKLFKQSSGEGGEEAPFMQLYFVMKPEVNGRIPVSKSPNKTGEPDGWLAKESFLEWNTLQMIQLEPQSGRKLTKVFDTLQCAVSFSKDGDASSCQELGSEPSAWGDKKFQGQKLLIPVFAKESDAFQGGFIRVFENEKSVRAASESSPSKSESSPSKSESSPSKSESSPSIESKNREQKALGYDVVFAIDSTGSMSQHFEPTIQAVQEFVKEKFSEFTGEGGQKIKTPLRMGILFYRDRPDAESAADPLCVGSYITQWRQGLTEQLDSIVNALKKEKEGCGGDAPEAILDALNRVIVDTQWQDNSFRAIILIGDAPAHGADAKPEKNPMKLSVDAISQQAEEKSIRFLNIKLGKEELLTFKALVEKPAAQNKGRYSVVPKANTEEFKRTLQTTLKKEWELLTTTIKVKTDIDSGETKIPMSPEGKPDFLEPNFLKKYGLTSYESLIIAGRIPISGDPTKTLPDFVKGWVSEKIQGRLAASEFIFIDKSKLMKMVNTLENIAIAALEGEKEGADAFISSIQNTLASQLSMQPSDIFRSGETVDGMLSKAKILPFKTTLLAFSAQELQSWKAPDYQRINSILKEKVKYIRELTQDVTAIHMFGDKPHMYVPRASFP